MDMMLWQIRAHEHLLPAHQQDARTIQRYRRKFVAEVQPQLKADWTRHPTFVGRTSALPTAFSGWSPLRGPAAFLEAGKRGGIGAFAGFFWVLRPTALASH
jgi:hypothetical protein